MDHVLLQLTLTSYEVKTTLYIVPHVYDDAQAMLHGSLVVSRHRRKSGLCQNKDAIQQALPNNPLIRSDAISVIIKRWHLHVLMSRQCRRHNIDLLVSLQSRVVLERTFLGDTLTLTLEMH